MNKPQPPLIVGFLLTTALLIIPMAAMAADAPSPGIGLPQSSGGAAIAGANGPTFDLDFPGGSVLDLLTAIEKTTGHVPNVIVGQGADKLKIPPLKVRGIALGLLFGALQKGGCGDWHFAGSPGAIAWSVSYVVPGPIFAGPPVHIFNIAPLLKAHDISDIIAAVQLALGMDGNDGGSRAQLKYHKETELLIMSGSESQFITVNEVLKALAPPASSDTKDRAAPTAPKP